MKSTPPEPNVAIVRRVFDELFNEGHVEVVDQIYAANHADHSAPPGFPPGVDAVKNSLKLFRAAFPDLRVTVEDIVSEDDKVAVRLTFRGTHGGEFMGIPPTGKTLTIAAIAIDRVSDGKITEHWVVRDDLGMLQQLGVIPALRD